MILAQPVDYVLTFAQSKYLTPTVVGTVRVTFNEATNQTAATTIFHSVRTVARLIKEMTI